MQQLQQGPHGFTLRFRNDQIVAARASRKRGKSEVEMDMLRTKEQIERRIKRLTDEKRQLEAQLRDVEAQLKLEAVRLKQCESPRTRLTR